MDEEIYKCQVLDVKNMTFVLGISQLFRIMAITFLSEPRIIIAIKIFVLFNSLPCSWYLFDTSPSCYHRNYR